MPVTPSYFKECLGCFATGVTVVSTIDKDGSAVGLTITSFNSVSLSPPLILFSLDKTAQSYQTFQQSEYFAVNILAEDQMPLSKQFARKSKDKWQGLSFDKGEYGCPQLPGVIVYIECETAALYEGGDHTIFVGKVVSMKKLSDKAPLIHYKGGYHNLTKHPGEKGEL